MKVVMPKLPVLIECFFTQRLMKLRRVSAHTIASYRDTFRLLLTFAESRLHISPSDLELSHLDAALIIAFLDHLEIDRASSARTRNLRLTAIRAFFQFAAFEEPAYSAQIQRVLAIPAKRHEQKLVQFLTRPEIEALLAAPDRTTWLGRRDHAILLLAVQTGLRLSELTNLDRNEVSLGKGAHVRCFGKGRKERCTPLSRQTTLALRAFLKELSAKSAPVLFPTVDGRRMSADAIQYLLKKHIETARSHCPSLRHKRVSPHVLRHTAAMELLQAGVDSSVIALWLGHESVETTQVYIQADLALKEKALGKVAALKSKAVQRYRAPDQLLAFLDGL